MWYYYTIYAASFAIHLFDGIVGSVILSKGSQSLELVQLKIQYTQSASDTLACPITFGTLTDYGTQDRFACTGVRVNPMLLLVLSEFVTAAFQVWYAIQLFTRHELPSLDWLRLGYHPIRWFEYGITATALSIANLVGTGTREWSAILFASVLLVTIQLFGLIIEWCAAREKPIPINQVPAILSFVKHASFVTASIFQVVVFVVVFVSAFTTDTRPPNTREFTGFQSQSFVYLFTYLSFPILAATYAYAPRTWKLASNFPLVELLYSLASVTSKVSIFWMIFAAVREVGEEYTKSLPSTGINWGIVRQVAIYVPSSISTILSVTAWYYADRRVGGSGWSRKV